MSSRAEMDKIAYMIGNKEYAEIRRNMIARLEEAIPDFSENDFLQLASDLIDAATWGYIDATLNFDQLVKMIYEMNPDVELIAVPTAILVGSIIIRCDTVQGRDDCVKLDGVDSVKTVAVDV